MDKVKVTVAAQKKLLEHKEARTKTVEMKEASKIISNEDEDLYIQSEAVQNYLE